MSGYNISYKTERGSLNDVISQMNMDAITKPIGCVLKNLIELGRFTGQEDVELIRILRNLKQTSSYKLIFAYNLDPLTLSQSEKNRTVELWSMGKTIFIQCA